ncbi:MAG: hypothetical protein IBX50_13990 [Marinospirillum sp.]|uniref:hypothetical protein n=1 Tax=Marinospirillum sp. TaxID=2183934 RepID=UPI001A0B6C92|nr:hypothetical protein [Marinospirillum sp.]MBE0507798.1 hypothetical protein [Marinospirillum sp.]
MTTEKPLSELKVTIDGVTVSVAAPYCTQKEWMQRTGMSLYEIRNRLDKGDIARHQLKPGGKVFVNVVQEIRKTIEAKPY